MSYSVGWNNAGYLPDSDPTIHDTLSEAVDVICELIDDLKETLWEDKPDAQNTADDVIAIMPVYTRLNPNEERYAATVYGVELWIARESE